GLPTEGEDMSKAVEIVGVPMDLGGNRRGVDMGPSAIRSAGLRDRLAGLGDAVRDRGNVRVADRDEGATRSFREVDKRELAKMGGKQAHHAEEIIRVGEELAGDVADIERSGAVTLVLSGDHTMLMVSLAVIARGGRRPGVTWMDVHGASNTASTYQTSNVHRMP